MPCINCKCIHLKVCAHRGEIDKAFNRVVSVGSPQWKKVTESIEMACPYYKSLDMSDLMKAITQIIDRLENGDISRSNCVGMARILNIVSADIIRWFKDGQY